MQKSNQKKLKTEEGGNLNCKNCYYYILFNKSKLDFEKEYNRMSEDNKKLLKDYIKFLYNKKQQMIL